MAQNATGWGLSGRAFIALGVSAGFFLENPAMASCMWGVVQPGAPVLGRLGGWEVKNTPGVANSWDILPTVTTYPPQTDNCSPCMETLNLDTSKTGQGIFFGTVGNTVTIQRAGGTTRTFGRLNTGLRGEHGARRGSAWVEDGRWVSYPAMSDQAPYTRKGASGGHAPNDALARNPQAPPPIVVTEPITAPDPTPYEEYVYKGTPRQVAKQVPKLNSDGAPEKDENGKIVYTDARDASGNVIYETAKDGQGNIIYDNDVWETVTIYPAKKAKPKALQPSQVQVPVGSFSFEAFPSYLLVQNEMITRVYPTYASGTAQGAKKIRMFGGSQGAVWSTDGQPLVSDVRYTGGDTTLKWMAKGWWQGELQPVLGPIGQVPGAGGTSYNVITLVNATQSMPIRFGGRDVLYDFYLPSGEMAIRGSGDAGDTALIQWNAEYRDAFVQATPAPVVAQAQPKPSPADNVIFYFNRQVNPAHKYKVVASPGAGSSISPDYDAVLGAISKAGQAAVESKLREGGGQDKHRYEGQPWTTTAYHGKWDKQHHFTSTKWDKRYDWFEGGSIVAINAATGEILHSLPARDWGKVTAEGDRVQVAGNWVNVVGYAGINTAAAVNNEALRSWAWTRAHPITISFGGGADFLAGEGAWRFSKDGRKPVLSAMRAFNFDGTGVKMWEWVGPTEGVLVWNAKGDTNLQPTGRELFGHYTWGKEWEDGSAAFRSLDKDGNGAVQGGELEKVWVWLDSNSDAIVQDGELTPIADKGVDSVAIPSEEDQLGGVVAVGGAVGPKGKFDVRDWWSVGGVSPEMYGRIVSALRDQPSIYSWTPTSGGDGSEGGLLRYMTPSEGRIAGISIPSDGATEAKKDTGMVAGVLFGVAPDEGGGFLSTVDYGSFRTVSKWSVEDGGKTLKGETRAFDRGGNPLPDTAPVMWTAKHLSGPTLRDVVDLASVRQGQ